MNKEQKNILEAYRNKSVEARSRLLDELKRTNWDAWLETITMLANIGVTALIDEATTYQNDRAFNALRKMMEGGK